MSSNPHEPRWRKIMHKAAPVLVAGLALSLATTVGSTVRETFDRHVQVVVHMR